MHQLVGLLIVALLPLSTLSFTTSTTALLYRFIRSPLVVVPLGFAVRAVESEVIASTGSSTRLMATAREIAETNIASTDVMVFSKSYCPYCNRAKAAITELGVEFKAMELDVVPKGADVQAALLEMTGQRTVPNIFVKGKHIGGCDATLAAISSGEFQKMLGK